MKNKIKLYIVCLWIYFLQSSCGAMYGIKKQKFFDKEKFLAFAKRNEIEKFDMYYVDKTYLSFIKLKSFSDKYTSFLLQPLQVHYFKNDSLVSSHVNCNVGGFPNLKWNEQKHFDIFPPSSQFDLGESFLLYSEIRPYLLNFRNNHTKITSSVVIIVFINLYFERQSKILIKQVLKNVALSEKNPQIIIVNNDSWFIE